MPDNVRGELVVIAFHSLSSPGFYTLLLDGLETDDIAEVLARLRDRLPRHEIAQRRTDTAVAARAIAISRIKGEAVNA